MYRIFAANLVLVRFVFHIECVIHCHYKHLGIRHIPMKCGVCEDINHIVRIVHASHV